MSLGAPDLYEVLGVSPTADAVAIKRAFWTLSRALHPDVTRSLSEEERTLAEAQYHKVTLAYDTLSDPIKRRGYDESRTTRDGARRAPSRTGPSDRSTRRPTGREPTPRFDGQHDGELWLRAQHVADASAQQQHRTKQQWQQYAAEYLRSSFSRHDPGADIHLTLELSRSQRRRRYEFRNPVDGHAEALPPSAGVDLWVYQYRGGYSRDNGPRGHLFVELVARSKHPLEPVTRDLRAGLVRLLRSLLKVAL